MPAGPWGGGAWAVRGGSWGGLQPRRLGLNPTSFPSCVNLFLNLLEPQFPHVKMGMIILCLKVSREP